MKIFITGICGFIGSNIAEYYAKKDYDIFGIDNFSREGVEKNHRYLIEKYHNIRIYNTDIRDYDMLVVLFRSLPYLDVVFHCAGQVAVTTSMTNPKEDFEVNALGSFNLLEAIRQSGQKPTLIYTSTNKVYGDNVNTMDIELAGTHYSFNFKYGIDEFLMIDHTSHSPYGVSKLSADLLFQEYGYTYGFKVGVFRMSCIYGPRQLGCEDQGWVYHFINSVINDKTINIYGDGKQIRDILYISDLIEAFDKFIHSDCKTEVFNMGGGKENTISLLELISFLETELDKKIDIKYHNWRPSDQKVYISDISKVSEILKWKPMISPHQGIRKVIEFIKNTV